MNSSFYYSLIFLCCHLSIVGQDTNLFKQNWEISSKKTILWNPSKMGKVPYSDNIEMAGKNIAAIIYYKVDEERNLSIEKDIIFPQLRTFNKSNEPDWKKYRAYFRRKVSEDLAPILSIDTLIIVPKQVDSIEIGGWLKFYYTPIKGLQLTKLIYPSMEDRVLVEEWTIKNISDQVKSLAIAPIQHQQSEFGFKGRYDFTINSKHDQALTLAPQKSYTFPIYFGTNLEEDIEVFSYHAAKKSRGDFLSICRDNLVLETPDSILNTLFHFAKIRAAESIYNSSMGLIHSPGGGNYYVGIWANDQVEYSGPFFPYLGYSVGNEAAYNTYKKFLQHIPEGDGHIPYAFEVDGNFPMTHLDRGDAAMIAYGTSLYLLNSGDIDQAKELWPLIEWALDYCHRKRNEFGAVQSESDEMEGRIPTGSANLSTSTLYYGGLKFALQIAKALNKPQLAQTYTQRLTQMETVIENYFGATIEGLNTYRYFDNHPLLRHWICLPLTMGITQRKTGTLKALFEKLWTDNGILVQYNPKQKKEEELFWDRATLYALRGALKVGAKEVAFEKLKQYSKTRLLGAHVPYPIEAFPENNMKHLSAESALYCRIFLEGLLGIEPLSFSQFALQPNIPSHWEEMKVRNVYLLGKAHDIEITRRGNQLNILITNEKGLVFNDTIEENTKAIITIEK